MRTTQLTISGGVILSDRFLWGKGTTITFQNKIGAKYKISIVTPVFPEKSHIKPGNTLITCKSQKLTRELPAFYLKISKMPFSDKFGVIWWQNPCYGPSRCPLSWELWRQRGSEKDPESTLWTWCLTPFCHFHSCSDRHTRKPEAKKKNKSDQCWLFNTSVHWTAIRPRGPEQRTVLLSGPNSTCSPQSPNLASLLFSSGPPGPLARRRGEWFLSESSVSSSFQGHLLPLTSPENRPHESSALTIKAMP